MTQDEVPHPIFSTEQNVASTKLPMREYAVETFPKTPLRTCYAACLAMLYPNCRSSGTPFADTCHQWRNKGGRESTRATATHSVAYHVCDNVPTPTHPLSCWPSRGTSSHPSAASVYVKMYIFGILGDCVSVTVETRITNHTKGCLKQG